MRKVLCLVLAVMLLLGCVACQPTPEEEVVVNRGDKGMEEKIAASPQPTLVPGNPVPTEVTRVYTFPQRWEEEYTVRDKLTIRFEADIVQRQDGMYPVYTVAEKPMTGTEAQELLEQFLTAQPVMLERLGDVKADWKRRMETYMEEVSAQQKRMSLPESERGDGDDIVFTEEEIKERMAYFQAQMDAAPESNDAFSVSDFSDVKPYFRGVYILADGSNAHVTVRDTGISVLKGAKTSWIITGAEFAENNAGYSWRETEFPQEQAEEMGQATLVELDMEGFILCSAEKVAAYEDGIYAPVAVGWSLYYARDFGGYPIVRDVQPSTSLKYGSGDGFLVNKRIQEETVSLFVTEEGAQEFQYGIPKEVVKLENPSVELLDWEQVQAKARQAFSWCLVPYNEEYAYTYSVYKAVLTWQYVRQADSEAYYAIPCWIFYYDEGDDWALQEREAGEVVRQGLYINAIDGSIVYTERAKLPER